MLSFLSEFNSDGLLLTSLADLLVRITLVLAVCCIVGVLLHRKSAAFRHGWWLVTLFAVACVPVAAIVLPGWGPISPFLDANATVVDAATIVDTDATDFVTGPATSTSRTGVIGGDVGAEPQPMQMADIRIPIDIELVSPLDTEGDPTTSDASVIIPVQKDTTLSIENGSQPLNWLACVWLFGCGLVVIRIIAGIVRMAGVLNSSQPVTDSTWRHLTGEIASQLRLRRYVALRAAKQEIGPLTGGLMNPYVLLPSGADQWTTDRRRVVLLHELAHAKRRDILSLWCSRMIATVIWFHPLVWIVCRQMRIERERACDDVVLAAGVRPSSYAQHLIEIASTFRCPNWIAATAMTMADKSQLEDRIQCVLDESRNRNGLTKRSVVMAACIVATMTITIATAGRITVRDSDGKQVATLNVPPGGSVEVQSDITAQKTTPEHNTVPDGQEIHNTSRWPQWGGTAARNNVTNATNLPVNWNVKSGENIRWTADLGSQSYGTPVVANGKVFVGTNNGRGYLKRYPKDVDLGCLVCFDQETGQFLWQHSNTKLKTGRVHDWPLQGICSTPVVQGNRLFYVTNRATITCLDTEGFRDDKNTGSITNESVSAGEADVVWEYDLMDELDVSPRSISGCSPTTDGKRLFVMTSNGVGANGVNPPSPNAPDFVCLDLETGKMLWKHNAHFPARDCQWSGPSIGQFRGQTQVIFPGGDGWVFGFDPAGDGNGNAKLLWKFDCNPKDANYELGGRGRKNLYVSMPVIHNGLVYVATGRNPEQGEGPADLWCIDPKRNTHGPDISEFLVNDNTGRPVARVDANYVKENGDTIRVNPDSGVVWHYTSQDSDGDGQAGFEETFHRSWGSPAIKDGLLVIADMSGLVHCIDAKTGKHYWGHDMFAACWGSLLIAEGRIYVPDEDGDVAILKLDKKLQPLGRIECREAIYSTPIAVGSTLYIATKTKLMAIQKSGLENRILKSSDDH